MKAIYNMALDRAVKDAGHKAAKADHRSLASLVELLLEQYCVARGYLPRSSPRRGLPDVHDAQPLIDNTD
jgi:hypothetical protein